MNMHGMSTKTLLIYDNDLISQCDKLPTMSMRASMVYDLLRSYRLLHSDKIQTAKVTTATDKELELFHTNDYVAFLKSMQNCVDVDRYENDLEKYGLSYDCPMFENCYDFVKTLAGGSSTAAKFLALGIYKTAINWCGGWHHAKSEKAEGFCYVNDIVIAIKILLKRFSNILYVDLDAHHGDGVETAFKSNKNVLTLSFHNYMPGFYPGSGSVDDIGPETAKYYTLNVPLLDGISDQNYIFTFRKILNSVLDRFEPNAIVVQCGADILNGDPVGDGNITLHSMGDCVKEILKCDKPTLFLGGGGYNFPNAARYWTYLTSVIIDENVSNEIPDDSQYFVDYAPSYELEIEMGNRKDHNTKEYLDGVISKIQEYCTHL